MSSVWLKPSIPQNCSIAYKYAQHLLLTNKKNPSSWDGPLPWTNHHMTGKGRKNKQQKKRNSCALDYSFQPREAGAVLAGVTAGMVRGCGWCPTEKVAGAGLAVEGTKKQIMPTKMESPVNNPGAGRLRALVGETRVASPRGRGPREGGKGRSSTFLSGQPATDGCRLLLPRLRANPVSFEEEGRNPSLPSSPVSESLRLPGRGEKAQPETSGLEMTHSAALRSRRVYF